ncbi:MAG: serine/threonine-protein kinase, partial [Acidobacteriota bacterium]
MKTEQWQRGQDIFAAAVVLPADERAPFVDAQCEGDPELRERVQRWLRADEAAGTFLDEPLAPPPPIPILDDASPTHLGAYRLLELIGEGGMGTVFRARRDDDVFDRDVAVKILSRFSMTQESERRFRFERRVLAALDHPWIARVYDGGTTPEGLPYLVIELVDGQPIDDYCDRRDLSIRERILLFRKVCAAVQASHRALVVHCDLKPSNILVTVDGEPKLLDFGVAKLLGGEVIAVRDEEITQWPRPLTPQYASPEQLRGGVISTTSDVYSLGVLLYKILTGQRPHDLEGLTLVEAIERVTTEPTPPSRVPAQAGGDTPPSAEATPSGLAGDLDAIVLKALRGDPDERYPSVEQLDADLGRHLEGFPVLARRGTVRYRA